MFFIFMINCILQKIVQVKHSNLYLQQTTPLLLIFLFLFFPVHCQDPLKKLSFMNEKQKSLSIPFKLVNNLIVIPLKINDSGSLNFILDTGLTTTLLTELSPNDSLTLNYAREIELYGLGEGEPLKAIHSFGNEITIVDIFGKNQDIYVVPENVFNLSARLGMPISGILGYSLFNNFIVRIDYSSRTIHFYDPEKFEYGRKHQRYKTIPLMLHNTKPYITLAISDSAGHTFDIKVLLDTGASHSIWLAPQTLSGFLLPEKTRQTFLGFGLNGAVTGRICRTKMIEIGGYSFKNPIIAIPDSASMLYASAMDFRNGSLGSEILKRFNLIIDYPNNELKIRPNSNFNQAFTQNLSGLEILVPFTGLPIFKVETVREDSPAWRAGLRADDELVNINGINVNKLGLDETYHILHSRPGKRINIQVFRNGEPLYFSFKLEEYI